MAKNFKSALFGAAAFAALAIPAAAEDLQSGQPNLAPSRLQNEQILAGMKDLGRILGALANSSVPLLSRWGIIYLERGGLAFPKDACTDVPVQPDSNREHSPQQFIHPCRNEIV
jgi:hypothetical protein